MLVNEDVTSWATTFRDSGSVVTNGWMIGTWFEDENEDVVGELLVRGVGKPEFEGMWVWIKRFILGGIHVSSRASGVGVLVRRSMP
jgi:hypothetical protein